MTATSLFAQNYERYKKLSDTTLVSKYLGFEKNISITVPIEWQRDNDKEFPLVIIFDRQNPRSHNYIIQTIDYLTSNEQMPSCVIISVESTQENRYRETLHKVSNERGMADENERFVFEELIPLAESMYQASKYRVLIGHSRYGYFTTSLLTSRPEELNAVVSLSPFFFQQNVSLTDSLHKLGNRNLGFPLYYRYGIGSDYPDDFLKMDSLLSNHDIPSLDAKGYLFGEADHNVTPGLTIGIALYEIFEKWSAIQSAYISNEQLDLGVLEELEADIIAAYGSPLSFSLGVLNGKGWFFYQEQMYDKAIDAWELLLGRYPNFSGAYLSIIDAQTRLNLDSSENKQRFLKSLSESTLYSEEEKKELMIEFEELD